MNTLTDLLALGTRDKSDVLGVPDKPIEGFLRAAQLALARYVVVILRCKHPMMDAGFFLLSQGRILVKRGHLICT